ncbi:MAG: hypothetical protein ABI680_19685, partial [Chthoniobacteraceae bacterium]
QFWIVWRVAHYQLLLVGGTLGILLLPLLHCFRAKLPGIVRRVVLIFFAVAAAGMLSALIEAYPFFAVRMEYSVRYGLWLPPVFFTLAFLSVLLGGAKAGRNGESAGGEVAKGGEADARPGADLP